MALHGCVSFPCPICHAPRVVYPGTAPMVYVEVPPTPLPTSTYKFDSPPTCEAHGTLMRWAAKHGDGKGHWHCDACAGES